MRHLLLFDIDGTLVQGGPAKSAFMRAMTLVFGTDRLVEGTDFSGKTDPQIAREILRGSGFEDREIDAGLSALWSSYLEELERRLPHQPMAVLPGVRPLLEHLQDVDGVALGLLTGNILKGARLKLGSVGLMDFFPIGSYGSDSEVREDLPEVAIRRAARNWGTIFQPSSVVVVGDTPRDVACGKHGGTRTVAVATGRYPPESLEAAGADRVLEDLGDLNRVVDALLW
jgi:phosphoglycolate phosphatase